MQYVIPGGGSGFIGSRLRTRLTSAGYDVRIVSRMPGPKRITWHDLEQNGLPGGTHAVINVAGQNVLDPMRRWTPGFRQNVWSSRVNTTAALVRAITAAPQRPAVFVSVSGVSVYPPDGRTYTELSQPLREYDYMSKLCHRWEEAANLPAEVLAGGTRLVKVRCGVVLGREGGMVQSLWPAFWWGVGGRVGDGTQPLPWIHADDIVGVVRHAVETPSIQLAVLNGVAPQCITNAEFTKVRGGLVRFDLGCLKY